MIVGIDLGTTNSLAAVWENGAARLIPNSVGEFLTPSCVSVDEDGSILVGRAARERLQTHPKASAANFKRLMGSDKTLQLGKKSFRPEELSALILRSLKEDVEAALGQPVLEAIITVPAYFSDAQRKATRAAGQLAGLKVERLLNEPTAAAMAYGIHLRDSESKFLVFDLGGGTFDVSVLDLFENVMEVRASAGDNYLGGEDFVGVLVERFFQEAKVPQALRGDPQFMQRLHAQVELAKRALSEAPQASIRVGDGKADYGMTLDEASFEKACADLLARLRHPVERALRDARLPIAQLDNIVLAGGATRMPIVRRMVARMFGRFPSGDINPDEVVALGAAVQAGLKMNDAALDEVVMTDVAPYSLGTDTSISLDNGNMSHGHFDPIIERNTVIPVSRVKRYYPVQDNQAQVDLNIYQGEARMAADNIKLGQLKIKLPPGPRDQNAVDVRLTYDVNGLLQVEATLVRTGEVHTLVIEGNPGLLTEAEIAQRLVALSELKIHPRDRMENRTLLARGERLYQQLRGVAREQLGKQITHFETALESQDRHVIAPALVEFRKVLDYFEHQSFLLPDD
ncbi:molecular chaperone HscC [Massilia sp. Dwa41.01b]|uniref:Hsp70 family protein n=1 Tax=unclassified Massilia TaxID=2609279 RepID=UPI0015FFC23B|nr:MULTISPECIES: molecular chaperone HscC [unclassified Massilia]QNA87288.1 molecular chaperone HscC [Massilia sp. Dwa41.01b]QNA98193.1 molecular chaperone HscC [Massilia sp. Se16.2.3]